MLKAIGNTVAHTNDLSNGRFESNLINSTNNPGYRINFLLASHNYFPLKHNFHVEIPNLSKNTSNNKLV